MLKAQERAIREQIGCQHVHGRPTRSLCSVENDASADTVKENGIAKDRCKHDQVTEGPPTERAGPGDTKDNWCLHAAASSTALGPELILKDTCAFEVIFYI